MRFFGIPVDILIDYLIGGIITKDDLKEMGRLLYKDLMKEDMKGLKNVFDALFSLQWGSFKVVAYSPKYVIISGKSTFAKLMLKYYGPQKEPVDHFIIGFLNAWAEDSGLKMKFEEVECIAHEGERCIFVGKKY